MKLINPGCPFVVMRWDEFEHLLLKLPKDELKHYLNVAGFYDQKTIDGLLQYSNNKVILSQIFYEIEEGL